MTVGPIMIMAGGTGGHVFPALAVAEKLREKRQPVIWLGTHSGLEARVVPDSGIEMEWISITGIRRRGLLAWLIAPFQILFAIAQALTTLHRRRPCAVLGMGGFVSGPGGIAAWLTRRPLLIHEQNAVAGTTNRLLARFARRIFEAFPGSFSPAVDATCIGNPVRRSIIEVPPPRERNTAAADRRLRLLVLGGSQGARTLNRVVPAALARLPARQRPEIWHQTGSDIEVTRAAYQREHLEPKLDVFIERMADAYSWADLVVARAGALTIAELSVCGVAAILVPYPYAVDDHQAHNAEYFAGVGAGLLIAEQEFEPERLARELDLLIRDRARLLRMAELARAEAKPDAADQLAEACVEYSGLRT